MAGLPRCATNPAMRQYTASAMHHNEDSDLGECVRRSCNASQCPSRQHGTVDSGA